MVGRGNNQRAMAEWEVDADVCPAGKERPSDAMLVVDDSQKSLHPPAR